MKCSYCGSEIEKGTGMMFVKKTGAIRYYCSTRCYKNNVVFDRKFNAKELRQQKA